MDALRSFRLLARRLQRVSLAMIAGQQSCQVDTDTFFAVFAPHPRRGKDGRLVQCH